MNWNHLKSSRFDYLTLEFDEVKFSVCRNTSSGVVCSRHGKGLKHGKGPCFLRPLNERWKYKVRHSHVYMSTYVYNIYIYIYIYRYVQRYTYFVCIHILDQHKSNSNTKGLRREIAFELLAVRNHMISQFPQGVVFLPCMIFLVQRCDDWNCLSWCPCRFDCLNFSSRTRFPRRGSLNTKTRSSWVQIKMNCAHEHRSCWIIMLSTNLSPKPLVFKSSKVVRSIQVRMKSFFWKFHVDRYCIPWRASPSYVVHWTPLLQLAPGKALVERGENIWKFKSCLVRWWVLRVSNSIKKLQVIYQGCALTFVMPFYTPENYIVYYRTYSSSGDGGLGEAWTQISGDVVLDGWISNKLQLIGQASTIDDKALTPRTSRCFSGIPYKMVMKRRKPCRFPSHILERFDRHCLQQRNSIDISTYLHMIIYTLYTYIYILTYMCIHTCFPPLFSSVTGCRYSFR